MVKLNDFCQQLCEIYKCRVVTKRSLGYARMIGVIAVWIGYKRFMDRGTTFGDTIAISTTKKFTDMKCVHEVIHVARVRLTGFLKFYWNYLFNKSFRIEVEVEAFVGAWQFDIYRRTGMFKYTKYINFQLYLLDKMHSRYGIPPRYDDDILDLLEQTLNAYYRGDRPNVVQDAIRIIKKEGNLMR